MLSKFEAFFMDKHFNLSQWKTTSSFLPAFGISLILILGLLIFISSIFNRIYLEKKAYKKDKTKFKITLSFKTLYTIFGLVFLLCGINQSLLFLKGEMDWKVLQFNRGTLQFSKERAVMTFYILFTTLHLEPFWCLFVFFWQINKQNVT